MPDAITDCSTEIHMELKYAFNDHLCIFANPNKMS